MAITSVALVVGRPSGSIAQPNGMGWFSISARFSFPRATMLQDISRTSGLWRSAGTAMEFALTLVEALEGAGARAEVEERLVRK